MAEQTFLFFDVIRDYSVFVTILSAGVEPVFEKYLFLDVENRVQRLADAVVPLVRRRVHRDLFHQIWSHAMSMSCL